MSTIKRRPWGHRLPWWTRWQEYLLLFGCLAPMLVVAIFTAAVLALLTGM